MTKRGERAQSRALRRKLIACLAAACGLGGCSSAPTRAPENLELFSWWVNPGEQPALDALVESFHAVKPDVSVTLTTTPNSALAREQIRGRMFGGAPPDTFQTLGGWDALTWALGAGSDDSQSAIEPLNSVVQETLMLSKLPAVVRSAVGFKGTLYAVPLDVSRNNVLFYNKRVFDKNQLTPPSTLDELYSVSEALKAKGIQPFALGSKDDSALSALFLDSILIASAGLPFRDSYLAGTEMPADTRIAKALSELTRILSYSNSNRDSLEWPAAARLVIDGSAAMTLVSDVAKQFFVSAGQVPNVDFGEVPFPGTRGSFVYLVDSFVLPLGAPSRASSLEFLKFLASTDATNVFASHKGTLPARIDADSSAFDALTLATRTDFTSNDLTWGYVALIQNRDFLRELDERLGAFASDGEVSTVENWLKSRYDQLTPAVRLTSN